MSASNEGRPCDGVLEAFIEDPSPVTEASVRKVTGGGSVTKLIEEIADDTTLAAREELLVKSLAKALVVDSIRQNLVADNVVLSPELLNAASHSLNCGVRRLLAQQLLRFADDHTTIREQLLRSHLFLALATLLVDEDLTVAQSAAKAAEKLVATTKGAWVRFSSDVFFDVLLTALRQGTTEVRLRLMGFFCRLALLPYPETEAEGDDDDDAEAALRQGKREAGQAAATAGESTQAAATAGESVRAAATAGKRPRGTLFKALAGRGVFDEIIQLSYIDDLLVKLNAVELIKELARSPEGLQFLIDVKLGAQLVQDVQTYAGDDVICFPLMHTLTSMIELNPQLSVDLLSADNYVLLYTLKTMLSPTPWDATRLATGIGCWANLCVNESSYNLMLSVDSSCCHEAANLLKTTDGPLWGAAAAAWTHVLEKAPLCVLESSSVWEVLQKHVAPQALVDLKSRPFSEARQACYDLLRGLCRLPKLLHLIFSDEMLRRFLVDIHSEQGVEARVAKHKFSSFATARYANELLEFLDASYVRELQAFAAGGAFYCPPGSAAASVGDMAA
eukprot:GHVT01028160.1.p1 GENE.GHVT01028160.1~~GHVT01028160.1.p1  ORF type:complete len:562 (-),score=146.62 GHVT01028160.1:698-2383(-)